MAIVNPDRTVCLRGTTPPIRKCAGGSPSYESRQTFTAVCSGTPSVTSMAVGEAISNISQADADALALGLAKGAALAALVCPGVTTFEQVLAEIKAGTVVVNRIFSAFPSAPVDAGFQFKKNCLRVITLTGTSGAPTVQSVLGMNGAKFQLTQMQYENLLLAVVPSLPVGQTVTYVLNFFGIMQNNIRPRHVIHGATNYTIGILTPNP